MRVVVQFEKYAEGVG